MKWIYFPFSLKQQKIKIKSPPTAGWCYFFVKVLLHVYWINFYFVLDSTRSPCSSHFADFYLKCFWRLFNFYSNNQFNSANCSAMLLSTDLNVIFTILLWMCLAGRHSEWLSSKSSWVNDEQKKSFIFRDCFPCWHARIKYFYLLSDFILSHRESRVASVRVQLGAL